MTLVDRPLVQYAIDEARAAGIREFIFVTSRGKGALEDYFDEAPQLEQELRKKGKTDLLKILRNTNMESGAIAYIRQHKALGLGHAVWCARRLIANEPFAVILPDDVIAADKPCLQQMVEAYEETGGNIVAAMEVPAEQASAYGILDITQVAVPDVVLRWDQLAEGLQQLAQSIGRSTAPTLPAPHADAPFTLSEIYDEEIEALCAQVYSRDYTAFGFGPWIPTKKPTPHPG